MVVLFLVFSFYSGFFFLGTLRWGFAMSVLHYNSLPLFLKYDVAKIWISGVFFYWIPAHDLRCVCLFLCLFLFPLFIQALPYHTYRTIPTVPYLPYHTYRMLFVSLSVSFFFMLEENKPSNPRKRSLIAHFIFLFLGAVCLRPCTGIMCLRLWFGVSAATVCLRSWLSSTRHWITWSGSTATPSPSRTWPVTLSYHSLVTIP